MATEQYTTLGGSTLASGYTAGGGSISVTSAASFPTTGNFSVRLNSAAIYQVTAVSGTTFTVTLESGTDINVSSGATVIEVVTQRVLDAIRADLNQFGAIGSLPGTTGQKKGNVYRATDASTVNVFDGSAWVEAPTGSLILLEEHTANNTSNEIDFTTRNKSGLTGNTFQSDFDEYRLSIVSLTVAASGQSIYIQVSQDSGASYDTAGHYDWGRLYFGIDDSGSAFDPGHINQIGVVLWYTDLDTTSLGHTLVGHGTFWDPQNTANGKLIENAITSNNGSKYYYIKNAGWWANLGNTFAYNAFRLASYVGSGTTPGSNFVSGKVRLYGVVK